MSLTNEELEHLRTQAQPSNPALSSLFVYVNRYKLLMLLDEVEAWRLEERVFRNG